MSRYRNTMSELLKQVRGIKEQDDKDHEISMARGELEAIADKATQLASALQGKSDDGNPLEAWVQSKITKAKDYINSVSDYLMYNPDMKQNESLEEGYKTVGNVKGTEFKVYKNGKLIKTFPTYIQAHDYVKQNEETELEESISVKAYKNAIDPTKKGLQINKTGGMSGTIFIKDKKELKDLMTKLTQATKLYNIKEELEEGFSSSLKQKAKEIAKKFANNMTKAVDDIEKLAKGLSDEPEVYKTIKQYNEQLEEKYTVVITKKDGSTMELGRYNTPAEAQRYVDMYGKGAKVKKEEVELDEIDEKISDIFKANKEGESIEDIAKRLKLSTSMVKKLIGEAKDEEEKKEEPKKEEDNKEGEIQSLKDQIAMLKQKLENEKNKAIKPEPNPETGEVPLTIGIAHAEFKKEKEKKEVKEDISEKAMTDREKRLQRAKDMIKYYDAQKKAALKGKNKDLAKKMLKNDTEIKEVSDRLKLKVLKKKIKQYKAKVFKKTMSTVKSPLFADKEIEEALEIKEFTSQMIDRLKKSFSTAPKKISPEQANKLSKHLDRIDLNDLRKLVKANIPFVSTVARNKIYKKTGKFEETNIEDRRLYVEAIAGLQKKADKSGMSYSILKKVYDRGMAAWKSGHRPGASQQQWAFARVNSFVTKSSGTWGGADKDLAKQVKGK